MILNNHEFVKTKTEKGVMEAKTYLPRELIPGIGACFLEGSIKRTRIMFLSHVMSQRNS